MALTKDDLQAIADLLEPIYVKLGIHDQRFDAMDQKFHSIDQRFDAMDQRFNAMDQRLDVMDQRFDSMDKRLDSIENRLDKVESEVSSLKHGQLDMRKDIKKVYDLALDAWGTSKENRNWLETAHI